jgi:hypothetical protein
MTAILLSISSLVIVIRVSAIYEQSRPVTFGLGALLVIQVIVQAVCCGFYEPLALKPGQGCIAAPKHEWGGIYWLAPTILYLVAVSLTS